MSAQTVSAFFSDFGAFTEFVDRQLAFGRAIVPTKITADLFEEVILRVVVGNKKHDIVATVAHPGLPGLGGVTSIGLVVSLQARDERALADLKVHLETVGRASHPDKKREASGPLELPEQTPEVPPTRAEPERVTSVVDEFLGEPFDILDPANGTPVQVAILEELIESRAPPHSTTLPGLPHYRGADRAQRGSVDAMIESALSPFSDSAAEPLNATEANDVAQYRALYPDKALRADEYHQAAAADAARGLYELARTNVKMAVAYNPTVPAYRELLEEVERRLDTRIR